MKGELAMTMATKLIERGKKEGKKEEVYQRFIETQVKTEEEQKAISQYKAEKALQEKEKRLQERLKHFFANQEERQRVFEHHRQAQESRYQKYHHQGHIQRSFDQYLFYLNHKLGQPQLVR